MERTLERSVARSILLSMDSDDWFPPIHSLLIGCDACLQGQIQPDIQTTINVIGRDKQAYEVTFSLLDFLDALSSDDFGDDFAFSGNARAAVPRNNIGMN